MFCLPLLEALEPPLQHELESQFNKPANTVKNGPLMLLSNVYRLSRNRSYVAPMSIATAADHNHPTTPEAKTTGKKTKAN